MLYKWVFHNDLSDEIPFVISDFRYSNNGLAIDWLRHFNKYSEKCQVKLYHLFIMNGYSLYLTYKFWSYAKEYNIILFHLPLYFIYLTQPLNVGYFQLFKYYYTQAIDYIIWLEDVEFGKL